MRRAALGVAEVADGKVAGGSEEPGLAGARSDVAPVLVDHPRPGGEGEARRLGIVVRPDLGHRVRAALGRGQRVDEGERATPQQRPLHLGAPGHPGARDPPQGVDPIGPALGLRPLELGEERPSEHVADDRQVAHPLALHEPPHLSGVERAGRREHHLPAEQERAHRLQQRRGVHQRRGGERRRRRVRRPKLPDDAGELAEGAGDRHTRGDVVLTQVAEQAGVAPDHALRATGRPARVGDQLVVAGPLDAWRGRALGNDRLVVERPGARAARAVSDAQERLGLRAGHRAGDDPGERGVEDERASAGVVEEVAELGLLVAVVDVDGDRPQLRRRKEHLEELDRVVEVDRHPCAGPDATGCEHGRELGAPPLELGPGAPAIPLHEHDTVAHGVRDDLPQGGEALGTGQRVGVRDAGRPRVVEPARLHAPPLAAGPPRASVWRAPHPRSGALRDASSRRASWSSVEC